MVKARVVVLAVGITCAAAAGLDAQTTSPSSAEHQATTEAQAGTDAAAQHLAAARRALTQVLAVPPQGDSQDRLQKLESHFAELERSYRAASAGTAADWLDHYAAIQIAIDDFNKSASVDEGRRAPLAELSRHLEAFRQSAGGTSDTASARPIPRPEHQVPAERQVPESSSLAESDSVHFHLDRLNALVDKALQAPAVDPTPVGTAGNTTIAIQVDRLTVDRATLESIKAHVEDLRRLLAR